VNFYGDPTSPVGNSKKWSVKLTFRDTVLVLMAVVVVVVVVVVATHKYFMQLVLITSRDVV